MFQSVTKIFSEKKSSGQKDTSSASLTTPEAIEQALAIDVPTLKRKKLLQIASALKKEKRYAKACDMLMHAFDTAPVGALDIDLYLRLPAYMQLHRDVNGAWDNLRKLAARHTQAEDQLKIACQMRDFLVQEGRFRKAMVYDLYAYARLVYLRKKSPIRNDSDRDALDKLYEEETIEQHIKIALEQAGTLVQKTLLVKAMHQYIHNHSSYQLQDIEKLVDVVMA